MGSVTVGLDDVTEKKLRFLAKERFKETKGAMAKVIAEGINGLEKESKRLTARKKLIAQMEKGFDGGKILFKHRNELYDRI